MSTGNNAEGFGSQDAEGFSAKSAVDARRSELEVQDVTVETEYQERVYFDAETKAKLVDQGIYDDVMERIKAYEKDREEGRAHGNPNTKVRKPGAYDRKLQGPILSSTYNPSLRAEEERLRHEPSLLDKVKTKYAEKNNQKTPLGKQHEAVLRDAEDSSDRTFLGRKDWDGRSLDAYYTTENLYSSEKAERIETYLSEEDVAILEVADIKYDRLEQVDLITREESEMLTHYFRATSYIRDAATLIAEYNDKIRGGEKVTDTRVIESASRAIAEHQEVVRSLLPKLREAVRRIGSGEKVQPSKELLEAVERKKREKKVTLSYKLVDILRHREAKREEKWTGSLSELQERLQQMVFGTEWGDGGGMNIEGLQITMDGKNYSFDQFLAVSKNGPEKQVA